MGFANKYFADIIFVVGDFGIGIRVVFGLGIPVGGKLSELLVRLKSLRKPRNPWTRCARISHCLATPGAQSRRIHMDREYDLFEIVPDGSALWRHTITGHEAIKGLRELSAQTANEVRLIHLPS